MYTFPVCLSQHHSFEENKARGQNGARSARQGISENAVRSKTCEGMSDHAHQGESSDEEWVDSASETASSASVVER